jgi:large subunit ribosomal protein L4
VHVLEGLGAGDRPSTKQAAEALAATRGGKRQLVVVDRDETVALLSVRNLKTVELLFVDQLNAYDVLLADDVVFTRAAMDAFVAAKGGAQGAAATDEEASA